MKHRNICGWCDLCGNLHKLEDDLEYDTDYKPTVARVGNGFLIEVIDGVEYVTNPFTGEPVRYEEKKPEEETL